MRHRMCLRQSDTVYSTAAEVVNNNCTSSDLEIRCRLRNARNRLQTSLNIELRQQLICKRGILNVSLKDIVLLCLSLPMSVGLFISVILLNLFFHNRLHPCIGYLLYLPSSFNPPLSASCITNGCVQILSCRIYGPPISVRDHFELLFMSGLTYFSLANIFSSYQGAKYLTPWCLGCKPRLTAT